MCGPAKASIVQRTLAVYTAARIDDCHTSATSLFSRSARSRSHRSNATAAAWRACSMSGPRTRSAAGVPAVHFVAVTKLTVTPPELLTTDTCEDLEAGPVPELDQLPATGDPLVHLHRGEAEAVREQRLAQHNRIVELTGRDHRGIDHLGALSRCIAEPPLRADDGQHPHAPRRLGRRE